MSMSKKSKTTLITASILFLTVLGTPLLKPAAALSGNYRVREVCDQERRQFEILRTCRYFRQNNEIARIYQVYRYFRQNNNGRWVLIRERTIEDQ